MFTRPTTFVIGAGASCELGLPDGNGLLSRIRDALQPDPTTSGFKDQLIQRAVDTASHQRGVPLPDVAFKIKSAAETIKKGLRSAPSIDNFLYTHRNDEWIVWLGKIAIAVIILREERNSHFFQKDHQLAHLRTIPGYVEPTLDQKGIEESWYPRFARLLVAGVERDRIEEAFTNLSFIIFNYDRCFEQFLWMTLQEYFDISADHASHIMSNVKIVHPYGSLGRLRWQEGDGPAVGLGQLNITDPVILGSRIKTFTESLTDGEGEKCKKAIYWSQFIVLLGFGFLKQNLELLQPDAPPPGEYRAAARVMSSAYNVSPFDQDQIRQDMSHLGNANGGACLIESGKCHALLDSLRITLSRA